MRRWMSWMDPSTRSNKLEIGRIRIGKLALRMDRQLKHHMSRLWTARRSLTLNHRPKRAERLLMLLRLPLQVQTLHPPESVLVLGTSHGERLIDTTEHNSGSRAANQ